MNYLLVFLLFVILFIIIKKDKNDLSEPSILFLTGFAVSSFILSLNTYIWNYSISIKTLIIIVLGVIIFRLGCVCLRKINPSMYNNDNIKYISISKVSFKMTNTCIIILMFIELCSLLLRILDMYVATGSFNIFSMIHTYKTFKGKTGLEIIIKLVSPLVTVIGLFSIIIIIQNIIEKRKNNISLYIIVILYFLFYSLSGERIDIIYMFLYCFITIFYMIRNYNKNIFSFKFISIILITILCLIFCFYWLGTFTGKTQMQTNLWDNLSMYSASSLAALDYRLSNFEYSISNLGTGSLRGLSNLLSYFGLKINIVSSRNAEFVVLGNMTHQTNVYSCLWSLISEFNYFFGAIVLFIEGLLCEYVYLKAKNKFKKNKISWLIFYIYLMGNMSISSIAERFFSSLLTLTTLFLIFFIAIFSNIYKNSYVKD